MDSLEALYCARLKASNVSLAAATYAKLIPLSLEKTASLWVGAPRQPSIQINYLSPLGKRENFYRIRLLGKANGFALEKPIRYLQPPHSGVRAYLPKVAGLNWPAALQDPTQPLIITEGEFKALAACLQGLPTIGLGGVENWRSAREGQTLLKELAAIAWEERAVYICYDSDIATKPQVAAAAQRLADELALHGAVVYDAGLPASASEKTGLDDFLIARGVAALQLHLRDAPKFASVAALHEFNRRFVFIRNSSKVYEPQNHEFYEAQRFVNSVEANTSYSVLTTTQKGPKLEKKLTAQEWIKWPNRRAVQRVEYRPGCTDLILPNEQGALVLNLWPGWGCEPRNGPLAHWRVLFKHLTAYESPAIQRWFEQWLAYPLQQPGTKLYTAVAIWGSTQGTGKTLLGETLLRIYGANGQRVGAQGLEGSFNGWAQYKQFILGDEITGNDSRMHADKLKGLITGDVIRINEKFEKEQDLPNTLNFYFTSNHPDAFFLDDKDRRYTIFEAPDEALPLTFYRDYEAWMRGAGPSALFHHLLHVDLEGFNPRAPAPSTHAKEVMIDQGKSDVGRFIAMTMLDPEQAERVYGVPAGVELFTVAELYKFYDPLGEKRATEKAVSLELQKQGAVKILKGRQIRIEGLGQVRIYAVRNRPLWRRTTKEQAIAAFNSRKMPSAKF